MNKIRDLKLLIIFYTKDKSCQIHNLFDNLKITDKTRIFDLVSGLAKEEDQNVV